MCLGFELLFFPPFFLETFLSLRQKREVSRLCDVRQKNASLKEERETTFTTTTVVVGEKERKRPPPPLPFFVVVVVSVVVVFPGRFASVCFFLSWRATFRYTTMPSGHKFCMFMILTFAHRLGLPKNK